jgi:hypothetical protein
VQCQRFVDPRIDGSDVGLGSLDALELEPKRGPR